MQQVIVENPVINSRYKEPCRHFRFSEQGISMWKESDPRRKGNHGFLRKLKK